MTTYWNILLTPPHTGGAGPDPQLLAARTAGAFRLHDCTPCAHAPSPLCRRCRARSTASCSTSSWGCTRRRQTPTPCCCSAAARRAGEPPLPHPPTHTRTPPTPKGSFLVGLHHRPLVSPPLQRGRPALDAPTPAADRRPAISCRLPACLPPLTLLHARPARLPHVQGCGAPRRGGRLLAGGRGGQVVRQPGRARASLHRGERAGGWWAVGRGGGGGGGGAGGRTRRGVGWWLVAVEVPRGYSSCDGVVNWGAGCRFVGAG